ncbi:Cytochrome C biogenesis protein transmembrane region [anaerobic digester metagenome]|jgi:cytochrome c biogenesis protein CcdA|uniref:Cytochrome C biogenesis protein n=1 Tax=Methanobacterium subterraneum TaxID=59277 RepID=A0A2H4VSW7_9EURY|nr:aromatic aminobenezylarsenical efflux permease ArsG family transporter [Methanobacterium subterraneum]AUB61204.1 cytochrome C biogenesis protein [Methanobacterium subterraneum]
MNFVESMATDSFPLLAAFFIGLMTAISPCPLATNITAIAYISKKIEGGKKTLITGFFYTLGRMFIYVSLASLIVYVGLNIQSVALFLQKYGEKILGPFLIIVGILLLNVIKFNFFRGNKKINEIQVRLSEKGYVGAFLLGALFALAFCPLSAVLFFGILIPLAMKFSDGILIPSVFAIATGLPVIIFSIILTFSIGKLGQLMNKVQIFEKWMRYIVATLFILTGFYYIFIVWI